MRIYAVILAFALFPLLGFGQETMGWIGTHPTPLPGGAMAYDRLRGQIVLVRLDSAARPSTFVWNGTTWSGRLSNAVPATRMWTALSTDVVSGRVLLFGGGAPHPAIPSGIFGDTWVWDGTNWVQQLPLASPSARQLHAMAYDAERNQVVLFGGGTSNGTSAETWVWDGNAWSLKNPPVSPPARLGHGMAYDPARQKVVLFGGIQNEKEVWEWDGNTWTGISVLAEPSSYWRPQLVYDNSLQKVLMYGGSSDSGSTWNADTFTWDGVQWSKLFPASSPAGGSDSAVKTVLAYDDLRSQAILLRTEPFARNLTETWRGSGGNWVKDGPPSNLPPARKWASWTGDTFRNQIVMFGGRSPDDSISYRDTWIWDGATWSERNPPLSPPQSGRATFDEERKEVVLFVEGQTWTWNGTVWTLKSPAYSPPVNSGLMAYDGARKQVVMIGGNIGNPMDTWTWDGSNWSPKNPSHRPVSSGIPMVYDARHGEIVLPTSGSNASGRLDTYTWNGVDWRLRSTSAAPLNQQAPAVGYDPVRGQVILLGEAPNRLFPSETWAWDGSSWTQLSTDNSPPSGDTGSLVFDLNTQKLLLFGLKDVYPLVFIQDIWRWSGGPAAVATPVTVTSSPVQCPIQIDGIGYAAPRSTNWAVGSSHGIAAPNSDSGGSQCVFNSWNHGGPQSQQVTGPPLSTVFQANYSVQYKLTLRIGVMGTGLGSISAFPPSADGYYPAGSTVEVSIIPRAGQETNGIEEIYGWNGVSPLKLTMDGPKTLTANFIGTNPRTQSREPRVAVTSQASTLMTLTYSGDSRDGGGQIRGTPCLLGWRNAGLGAQFLTRTVYDSLAAANFDQYNGSKWSWYSAGGLIQGNPGYANLEQAVVRDTWNAYWIVQGFGEWRGPYQWTFLGGNFATDPVVARFNNGLGFYVVGKDRWDSLWVGRFLSDSGFQGWVPLGGIIKGTPAATAGHDGILYIAAQDHWNSMWLARVHGDRLLDWRPGGGIVQDDPSIAALSNGMIAVVIRDFNGGAWYRLFRQGDQPGWLGWNFAGGQLQTVEALSSEGELYLAGLFDKNYLVWHRVSTAEWKWAKLPLAAGAYHLSAGPK